MHWHFNYGSQNIMYIAECLDFLQEWDRSGKNWSIISLGGFYSVHWVWFFFDYNGVRNLICFLCGTSHSSVELPPELCPIIMSPLSVSKLYSFSIVPSIMHHLESLLHALNLKKMILDRCTENVTIPTITVCYICSQDKVLCYI